ncbi:MAG: hypothetical protein Q8Q88_10985 [Phenylobacterium sp.]|uniref:hypothetical protein n=1 Tax=Phenylobacterium sp. TaxID=1871053 RepID=UPI0027325477|nr:hypothetical protein [Phenylobacterium sp.]MDP3747556.1 hypothetical protein [Phenylobacterium sp.]
MVAHLNLPNLRRPAISLALNLGWTTVLVATIETLSRFGEAFAPVTGFAAVLFLQLMSVALLVRALAECLVALLALILAVAAAQTPIQEPVTA